jgi:hypothetical protein
MREAAAKAGRIHHGIVSTHAARGFDVVMIVTRGFGFCFKKEQKEHLTSRCWQVFGDFSVGNERVLGQLARTCYCGYAFYQGNENVNGCAQQVIVELGTVAPREVSGLPGSLARKFTVWSGFAAQFQLTEPHTGLHK